ncbi:hypothetical protein FQA47_020100 [Oryzias melastigma]|uniref:Uncharacterized protein n=1 Tax=Oryzias melastigma TaxID=30732 RepID=A0A834KX42_ORYME|nr:hypothetical protein FQA47_020100 [Oryzias melastigma]
MDTWGQKVKEPGRPAESHTGNKASVLVQILPEPPRTPQFTLVGLVREGGGGGDQGLTHLLSLSLVGLFEPPSPLTHTPFLLPFKAGPRPPP